VVYQGSGAVLSILLFGSIIHFHRYRELRLAAQNLQIEKQQAELDYLKSQTHPHFLFNTLNNIYALTRDKSDLAPESILRLSAILRFMLYDAGGASIALAQEVKIISDYIALEKLRYDDSVPIRFTCDVDDMHQRLPPLLLLPLVENAFKHGVSETIDKPSVNIHLATMGSQLVFRVENSTDAGPEDDDLQNHIGLGNLRRRLELLHPEYSLSLQKDISRFTVILRITLPSQSSDARQ
jgi:LytS/YehU family sensor histidine kinase